ncbi:MAG: hypothetical protein AYP45_08165 [Candidatus Brocadia carolinensis]|uniref:Uncharacterized protein n=1 Tax=Candidatus Brocadia carolinensis TaxID=1004156 RepID=A0A1V4ATV9_9BACT|nr:MAG: hypothetical protein AYP45_08165 [Candidatus Brocadia caroliniensis]
MCRINRNHFKYSLYIFVVIIGCLFNNIVRGKELSSIQRFLKDKGYVPLDLPRDDYRPGCIIEKEGDRRILCSSEQCFPSSVITRYEGNIADIQFNEITNRDYNVDLKADIKQFQKIVRSKQPVPDEVKTEFITGISKNVTMKLQNVKSVYVTMMDMRSHVRRFGEGSNCSDVIKNFGPCIVIQEALMVDNLQYIFHKSEKSSLKALINWLVSSFTAQAVKQGEEVVTLTVTTPRCIAYKAANLRWRENQHGFFGSHETPGGGPMEEIEIEDVSVLELLGDNLYWESD